MRMAHDAVAVAGGWTASETSVMNGMRLMNFD
jgi:hypothetical protein